MCVILFSPESSDFSFGIFYEPQYKVDRKCFLCCKNISKFSTHVEAYSRQYMHKPVTNN